MTHSEPWLEVKGLSFKRGRQIILDNINLSFHPGRHYIMAGPNGAGKSTLFDIMAGLLHGYDGTINILGRPLPGWKKMALAQNMALAPQDYRLDFPFTVREMISFGRRPYLNRLGYLNPEDHQIIEKAMTQLDITDLAEKAITGLSGGEKQRAILARTLAQQTRILLLDEPTAGLDVAHALKMMKLAQNMAVAGHLVITVTHDLPLAASYGHEFIFLKKGRLAACGPIGEVLRSDVLADVYEVEALVDHSVFTGGPTVQFREPTGSDLRS